jgi:hypothetical protein
VTAAAGITQGQRAAWQRHAVATLANILERNTELPLISWTVCSAGCAVAGRVNPGGGERLARATFESWRQAIGLNEPTEVAGNGAGLRRATGHNGIVKVTITAAIAADAGEE